MFKDFDRDYLANFNCSGQPLDVSTIPAIEDALGIVLPNDYVSFLKNCNGGEGFIGRETYAIFWRIEELVEMNLGYEVKEYAPGLVIFGSDGGGEAFAFDTRQDDMAIVSVPFVGMDLRAVRPLAKSFIEFLDVLFNVE